MTYPFQDPLFLLPILLLGWVAVRLEFFILRFADVRWATAGPRKLATWATVIVLAAVPLHVLRFVAGAILLLAIAQGVVFLVVVGTARGRRRILAPHERARLEALAGSRWAITSRPRRPLGLGAWMTTFERCGFVPRGDLESEGVRRTILHRPTDGAIASIVEQPPRFDLLPLPIVQLVSVAQGRAGVLSTSFGFGPDACPHWIAQVFPLPARQSRLIAAHDEARVLLQARGIRFEVITVDGCADVSDWLWGTMLSSLLALPDDALLSYRRTLRKKPRILAAMLDHPEVSARIDAWGLATAGPIAHSGDDL